MAAPLLHAPLLLPDDYEPPVGEVLLDLHAGGFAVLLDRRMVAWTEDADAALVTYRAVRQASRLRRGLP